MKVPMRAANCMTWTLPGLPVTLQQVVMAAKTVFGADGAGIMLADADGELR